MTRWEACQRKWNFRMRPHPHLLCPQPSISWTDCVGPLRFDFPTKKNDTGRSWASRKGGSPFSVERWGCLYKHPSGTIRDILWPRPKSVEKLCQSSLDVRAIRHRLALCAGCNGHGSTSQHLVLRVWWIKRYLSGHVSHVSISQTFVKASVKIAKEFSTCLTCGACLSTVNRCISP